MIADTSSLRQENRIFIQYFNTVLFTTGIVADERKLMVVNNKRKRNDLAAAGVYAVYHLHHIGRISHRIR